MDKEKQRETLKNEQKNLFQGEKQVFLLEAKKGGKKNKIRKKEGQKTKKNKYGGFRALKHPPENKHQKTQQKNEEKKITQKYQK